MYTYISIYVFNTMQHTATYCNILQHTATHYNTLQHTRTWSLREWIKPQSKQIILDLCLKDLDIFWREFEIL